MAIIMSGKAVAENLEEDLTRRVDALKIIGKVPSLAIIRCGANPSDMSYEKGIIKKAEKLGIEIAEVLLPEDVQKDTLIAKIEMLNEDESIDGVLMFRPLPAHLKASQTEICNRLDPAKDVDCQTIISNAGVYEGLNIGFAPCTPEACMELLKYYHVELKGKNVVVIGRSLVVGKPLAMMLMAENATVTICHTRTIDVASITRNADIVVASAGSLGMLTKDYVAEGQIVVDVSINWDPSKRDGQGGIAGDCVFEDVEKIVHAITPVPGGVGAITTTVLLGHVVTAAENKAY